MIQQFATVQNAGGTINGSGGVLTVNGTVTGGTVSGNIAGGATGLFQNLNFNNAAVTGGASLSGNITTDGINTITTGTGAQAADVTVNTGSLTIGDISGNYTISAGHTTDIEGGATMFVPAIFTDFGTLQIAADGTLDPTIYTLEEGGNLDLNGTLEVGLANLIGGTVYGSNGGTIEGAADNSGADIHVGDTPASTLDFSGNYVQTGGDLNFALVTPGDSDELLVGGALDITGGSLDLVGGDFSGGVGTVYTLIAAGSITQADFSSVTPLPVGWGIEVKGNDVELVHTPEPYSLWLFAIGLLGIGMVRRRGRK